MHRNYFFGFERRYLYCIMTEVFQICLPHESSALYIETVHVEMPCDVWTAHKTDSSLKALGAYKWNNLNHRLTDNYYRVT